MTVRMKNDCYLILHIDTHQTCYRAVKINPDGSQSDFQIDIYVNGNPDDCAVESDFTV